MYNCTTKSKGHLQPLEKMICEVELQYESKI